MSSVVLRSKEVLKKKAGRPGENGCANCHRLQGRLEKIGMEMWIKDSEIIIDQRKYEIPSGEWVHIKAVDRDIYIRGAIVHGEPTVSGHPRVSEGKGGDDGNRVS